MTTSVSGLARRPLRQSVQVLVPPITLRGPARPLRGRQRLWAPALLGTGCRRGAGVGFATADQLHPDRRRGAGAEHHGTGVALGVAAVTVMGPAFAVLPAVGSAFKGAEIGGLLAAVGTGERARHPSPIVLHIKALAPPGAAPP